MLPILFSIGGVHIASFSVLVILAWVVWSFVFWKLLRSQAVEEERIFDLTFYATLTALVGSRAGFVLLHQELFVNDWLAAAALWVQPGMSFYGGLVGGLVVIVFLSRTYRVRLGHVLDALAISLPAALLVGDIGSLLDGTEVGIASNLPWAVSYAGHVGRRQPVQVYEMIALVLILIILWGFGKRAEQKKWPYGLVGIWFFLLFSVAMFGLEFVKDSRVYFLLRANQWVLLALFAETLGAFYVRGGGREWIRPNVARGKQKIATFIQDTYAKFSKRRS